jgi:hypothetical protein
MLRVLDGIPANRVRFVAAFFAIYVIWGSSFVGVVIGLVGC